MGSHPFHRLLIGSLEWDEWCVAITKFLAVMAKKKNREWMDIKELTPLQFMPYMAKLFREVTGQDLSGLGHFTGWISLGGYYHWRVAQQGLIHLVPHLVGQSMPRTPDGPNPDSIHGSLWEVTGQESASPWWEQTGTHPEPGWMAVHLRPEWNDHSPQAKWKVIHSLPERWTGLLEWKWDPSSLRRSSQPSPREGRSQ